MNDETRVKIMKTALPYFLLLVALVLLFSLWRSNRELAKLRLLDNKRMQEIVEAKQAEILTRDRAIFKRDSLRTVDSLKFRVAETGLKIEISTYKKTIARLRPLVQEKIDSFPDLRDFVAAQDSTISHQDSLIYRQELFCTLQIRDLQEIVQLTEQKYAAQEQITAAVTAQLAKEVRQHRKTKFKSTLKSIGLGILTGGIIYISLRE